MVSEEGPGSRWPVVPLQGAGRLTAAALKDELVRFAIEKFDGLRPLILDTYHEASSFLESPAEYELAQLARFREVFLARLAVRLEPGDGPAAALEVIPFRSAAEHEGRRRARVLTLMGLALRRLEHRCAISDGLRLRFLETMIATRALDEQLKAMFFPGVETPIPGRRFGGKGFRSTWQEAIAAVGVALDRSRDERGRHAGDVIAPLIRDLGAGLAFGYHPKDVLAAQLGKAGSPMNGGHKGAGGRDLHWGELDQGILFATAPLAIAASTMTGVALGFQRRGEARIGVTFIGEGGSSQGDWYEALNFAGVRRLPILFFVENNRVALGTAVERQSAVDLFADKAAAAGIPSFTVDGTDPAGLYAATRAAREYIVAGRGPVLIGVEAMRGCGHAHHDDERYRKLEGNQVVGYVDEAAYARWQGREPIGRLVGELIARGALTAAAAEALQTDAAKRAAAIRAEVEAMPWAEPASLGKGISPGEDAPSQVEVGAARRQAFEWRPAEGSTPLARPLDEEGWTYRAAIEEALCEAAVLHGESLILLGEDLEYGGAFGITQRLKSRGQGARLLDTPLSESVVIGAAVGLALSGFKPVAELQFNAFAAHAFSQIVNNAATIYWRTGRPVPLVIRIPVGAGLAGGPYHALSNEAWFTSTPGLKILAPSTPHDAYHGLLEAIADPGPVLFLEHLTLYPPAGRTTPFGFAVRQTVPKQADGPVLGRADLKRKGRDLSIVTWGAMVHFALQAAERLAPEGIELEVLDLRSLWPLDIEAARRSVEATKRLIVLQEAQHRGGYGHYVLSRILEKSFMALEAPPLVLGAMDIFPPFAPHLEAAYLPSVEGIASAARDLIEEVRRG